MATVSVEAQVIELVAETTEIKPEKVLPTSRLLEDFGMDGDDAASFFNRVHERFGTDLTHLHEHWREHFGPEGVPCSAGLVIIPAALSGGLVGSLAGFLAGTATTVALLAASVWVIPKLGLADKMKSITVNDVVRAVEAGSWPPPA